MNKYIFRSKYYTNTGIDIDRLLNKHIRYVSAINKGGDASAQNPINSMVYTVPQSYPPTWLINILANGMYRNIVISTRPITGNNIVADYSLFIGQHMLSTVLSPIISMNVGGNNTIRNYVFKDLCFAEWTVNPYSSTTFIFYRCFVQSAPLYTGNVLPWNASRCMLGFPNNSTSFIDQGQNSYICTNIVNKIDSLALYDNCNVTLDTKARLTTYLNTWAAFNDCKFKIGNELEWKPLIGTTEEDLRASFVSRCEAQFGEGAVPNGSEFGDINMPMYRWIFATNSSKNGVPLKDSSIHRFEKRRFITFGYEDKRDGFSIAADATSSDSFNPAAPNAALEFNNNSLMFPATTDITNRVNAKAQTNIKWLGGKYKLTGLDVVHNMPADFGVMVDSTPTIDFTPVGSGSIEADELYIVRSTDKNYAAVTYNGVSYNTALSNNNFVIRGVSGQTGFTATSGSPVIYKLTDFVQHQTLELRIVNKLPDEKIRSGAVLLNNYWYFVEHDTDQSNTTDFVLYDGKKYYAGSSFLVKSSTSFSVTGNIHLRRTWNDNFDFETESLDKEFWRYEQKPEWCKIVLGDTLRCFMKANSDRQNEMQKLDGEYLTTGHPDFYKMENGDGGLPVPSFPIQGTYLQLRLTTTTTNPM